MNNVIIFTNVDTVFDYTLGKIVNKNTNLSSNSLKFDH